jgi:hypothetical protein
MDVHFARHLKLAIAVSLLCLWCALMVLDVADLPLLLLASGMLQWPREQFTAPTVWKWREGLLSLLALASIFFLFWLASRVVSEQALKSFWHNPATVFVFFAIGMFGLVRQATVQQRRLAPNNSLKRTAGIGTAVD